MQEITAIALVSGGMDSLVSAALALEKHERVGFLHLSYGQRTAERNCPVFTILQIFIPSLGRGGRFFKAIFEGNRWLFPDRSKDSVEEYRQREAGDIPDSYVPFRNTHILSTAVSWAEVVGASFIYIGAVAEDSSGYPDCRLPIIKLSTVW